jgi:hypothetical protein
LILLLILQVEVEVQVLSHLLLGNVLFMPPEVEAEVIQPVMARL